MGQGEWGSRVSSSALSSISVTVSISHVLPECECTNKRGAERGSAIREEGVREDVHVQEEKGRQTVWRRGEVQCGGAGRGKMEREERAW